MFRPFFNFILRYKTNFFSHAVNQKQKTFYGWPKSLINLLMDQILDQHMRLGYLMSRKEGTKHIT